MRGSGVASASSESAIVAQRLVVDVDEVERLGRRLLVARDDRGDGVADEAHAVAAERLLVLADRQDAERDRAGPCRSGRACTPGRAAARAASMRAMRACGTGRAQELAVQHARQHEVVGEARLAGDLGPRRRRGAAGRRRRRNCAHRAVPRLAAAARGAFAPRPPRPPRRSAGSRCSGRGRRTSASRISSRVGCARAVEQRLRGDEDPRRAVAALRAAEIGERLLQRVQPRVRSPAPRPS